MYRRLTLLLCSLALLTACSKPTEKVVAPPQTVEQTTPAPAQPTPVTSAAATPGARPMPPELAPACDPKAAPAAQMAALEAYIQSHVKGSNAKAAVETLKAGCLQPAAAPNEDVLLVTTRDGGYNGPAAAAWLSGGTWHEAPVWDGDKPIVWILSIGAARIVDGRPEVILDAASGGSGGAHRLMHFQVRPDGSAVTTDTGPGYGRTSFHFLRFDLVHVRYRSLLYDLVYDCNGCVPSAEEDLIRWDGSDWQSVARRINVDPEVALNLMFAYLGRGDRAAAAKYVADPSVLDAAQRIGHPAGSAWYQIEPDISQIRSAGSSAWDALPAEFRTTIPPLQTVYSTVVQTKTGASIPVLFTRNATGWVVSRMNVVSNAPVAAPATSQDVDKAFAGLMKAAPADRPGALGNAVDTLLHYLLTIPGGKDSPPPYSTVLNIANGSSDMRLIHLGDDAFVRRFGTAWTWLQWGNGLHLDPLSAGNTRNPQAAYRITNGSSDYLVVLWNDPQQPGAQTLSLHWLIDGRWEEQGLDSWDLYQELTAKGLATSQDYRRLVVDGKDGAHVTLSDDAKTVQICRKDGTCVTAVWKDRQYDLKK